MTDPQELLHRGQQYRNYHPDEFMEELDRDLPDEEYSELQDQLADALVSIEAGRFEPFLARTSLFFRNLTPASQTTFTRRNPDLVQWMAVYQRVYDSPYFRDEYELGDRLLGGEKRNRMTEEPPPFVRRELGPRQSILESVRARGYGNIAPVEMMEVAEQEWNVGRHTASVIGLYDAEIIEGIDRWPIEVNGKLIARTLLPRFQNGTFGSMLKHGHKFFLPLDVDEMRLWVQRNPGVTMWFSVWAFSEDLIWGEQMVGMLDMEWPPLATVSQSETAVWEDVQQETEALLDDILAELGSNTGTGARDR